MSIRSLLATSDGVFLTQVLFSFIGICFSAGMLIKGSDPSIYLPILTSVLFAWTPSPRSNPPPVLPLTTPPVPPPTQPSTPPPVQSSAPPPTLPSPPPTAPLPTLAAPQPVILQDLQMPPQRTLRTTTRARRAATPTAAAGAADNV